MRSFTPEMAWHNRDPVFSVDIQSKTQYDEDGQPWYRVATAGGDMHVIIWKIKLKEATNRKPLICEPIADILRHTRSINVLRFAPKSAGNLLASADDDGLIFIWKYEEQSNGAIVIDEQPVLSPSSVPETVTPETVEKSPSEQEEKMDTAEHQAQNETEAANESDKENDNGKRKPELITISSPTTVANEKERKELLDDTIESVEQWSYFKCLRGNYIKVDM